MEWTERLLLAGALFAVGLLVLVVRILTDRPGRLRDRARAVYLAEAIPWVPYRMGLVAGPLLTPVLFAWGLAVLVPRLVGAWLSVFVLVATAVVFLVSFRAPSRLMPGWMRDEIARGELPTIRPDWFDRLLLGVLVVLMLAGAIAAVLLIVVFHGADSVR